MYLDNIITSDVLNKLKQELTNLEACFQITDLIIEKLEGRISDDKINSLQTLNNDKTFSQEELVKELKNLKFAEDEISRVLEQAKPNKHIKISFTLKERFHSINTIIGRKYFIEKFSETLKSSLEEKGDWEYIFDYFDTEMIYFAINKIKDIDLRNKKEIIDKFKSLFNVLSNRDKKQEAFELLYQHCGCSNEFKKEMLSFENEISRLLLVEVKTKLKKMEKEGQGCEQDITSISQGVKERCSNIKTAEEKEIFIKEFFKIIQIFPNTKDDWGYLLKYLESELFNSYNEELGSPGEGIVRGGAGCIMSLPISLVVALTVFFITSSPLFGIVALIVLPVIIGIITGIAKINHILKIVKVLVKQIIIFLRSHSIITRIICIFVGLILAVVILNSVMTFKIDSNFITDANIDKAGFQESEKIKNILTSLVGRSYSWEDLKEILSEKGVSEKGQ